MSNLRFRFTQKLCRYLPPIISQQIRHRIYSRQKGYKDSIEYTIRSLTGSLFQSSTSDFHGYVFGIHGYNNWRAWAIALSFLRRGDTVLEIGANVGTETIGFADLVGCDGHVYAFEPLPKNIAALRSNFESGNCHNVTVLPFAISDKVAQMSFEVPPNDQMSGIGRIVERNEPNSPNYIDVESKTLDHMIDQIGSAKFVFIDAEGAEYSILGGGQEFIKEFKPIIILEAGTRQLSNFGYSLSDLYELLDSFQYSVYDIQKFSVQPIKKVGFSISASNWLCIPRSLDTNLISDVNKNLFLCAVMPCIKTLNPLCRKLAL